MHVRAALAIIGILSLAACTGTSAPVPTPTAESLGPPGQARCSPASPTTASGSLGSPEVQGMAAGSETLYGMVQDGRWPPQASPDVVKIVWRMTGSGDLTVVVENPSGVRGTLAWGPESHVSSNYDRPGDEWGSGLVMNAPGCWHLAFTRAERGTADVWLSVSP